MKRKKEKIPIGVLLKDKIEGREKLFIFLIIFFVFLVIAEILLLSAPVLKNVNYKYKDSEEESIIVFSGFTFKETDIYGETKNIDVGFYYTDDGNLIIGGTSYERKSVFSFRLEGRNKVYTFTSTAAIIIQVVLAMLFLTDCIILIGILSGGE